MMVATLLLTICFASLRSMVKAMAEEAWAGADGSTEAGEHE